MVAKLPRGVPIAREVALGGAQKIVAERMVESQRTAASVTTLAEVSAEALFRELTRLRSAHARITLTHLLIKATALCLAHHPRLNAALHDGTIYEFAVVHMALALSLPSDDLQAVVIRDANAKSVAQIATETRALRERASAGKLALDDVRGGTFTISNYGKLRHTVWATPIITPGQTGVLGIGRARTQLVTDEQAGQAGYSVQRVLPLSLTYDHRVVNGVPAGQFLEELGDLVSVDARLRELSQ